jgi:hypothetical protein
MKSERIRLVRRCPLLEAKADELARRSDGRGCNAHGVPWERVVASLRSNSTASLPCLPVSGDTCLQCASNPRNPDLYSQPGHSYALAAPVLVPARAPSEAGKDTDHVRRGAA